MTNKDTLVGIARIFVDAERKLAAERGHLSEAERQLASAVSYRDSKMKILLEQARVTAHNPLQIICIAEDHYVLLQYAGQSSTDITIVDQRETGPARN